MIQSHSKIDEADILRSTRETYKTEEYSGYDEYRKEPDNRSWCLLLFQLWSGEHIRVGAVIWQRHL